MKTTKTQSIMNHLRESGPVSSANIAAALPGVRTKDVTALLKKQIARGQVIRSAGLLSINPSWDDRLVEAMRLLRQAGYTIYEPGSRPAGVRVKP